MHLSVTHLRARFVLTLLSVLLIVACTADAAPIDKPTLAVPPASAGAPTPSAPADASGSPPATGEPTAAPTPTPFAVWLPPYQPLPPITLPDLTTPAPTEPPEEDLIATTTGNAKPTHLVIPALGIDLAVMKGGTEYPYCNVAQYLTSFVNPGQPGTTYMYGHARKGMMLPFLTRSKINDGASMIGMKVYLYTADKKLHLYRINIVKRHARNFSLAYNLDPGEHRLIMQTSEGPDGSYPKLQIAARPIGVYLASAEDALVTPHPRICS